MGAFLKTGSEIIAITMGRIHARKPLPPISIAALASELTGCGNAISMKAVRRLMYTGRLETVQIPANELSPVGLVLKQGLTLSTIINEVRIIDAEGRLGKCKH